ncbi:MAG: PAS domain-containing protein [Oligoflexia bacterium]|nr:PAS domain-containing protein [Oligoflexia bacterium]
MQTFDYAATFKIIKILEDSKLHDEFALKKLSGIWGIIAKNGQILKGNDNLLEVLNCDEESIIAQNFSQLFPHENWPKVTEQINQVLEHRQRIQFELGIIKENQNLKKPAIYSWNISFFNYFQGGQLATFVIDGQDITHIKEAQLILRKVNEELEVKVKQRTQELLESQLMLRNILDTIPVGVYWKDNNLKYLGSNDLFAKDAKINDGPSFLIGKDDSIFPDPIKAAAIKKEDQTVLNSLVPIIGKEVTINYPKETDTTYLKMNIVPLKNKDQQSIGILGTYEDITNIKKMEKERENLQNQLFISSKLASLATITAGVAHEISNPLTILKGHMLSLKKKIGNILKDSKSDDNNNSTSKENNVSNLNDQSSTNEQIKIHFEKMSYACDRISSVIYGMRTQLQENNSDVKMLDIHQLIDSFAKELVTQEKFNSQIQITLNLNAKSHQLITNETKFKRILGNIVDNSLDALEKVNQKNININSYNIDNKLIIKITDSGVGIATEIQSKVFDAFFTTKEIGKGMGLGLWITYNLLKEMNGTIEFKSELNKGTVITLSFTLN